MSAAEVTKPRATAAAAATGTSAATAAAVAADVAPWDERDVLVVQGGTWDAMCERELRDHLDADVPAFVGALRAVRASDATRRARLIYVSNNAAAAKQTSTGWRNSWSHAAANAFVRRELLTHAAELGNVTIVDQLSFTWPRHEASPDFNHYVRKRFNSARLNSRPARSRDGRAPSSVPPADRAQAAPCIGDAGMAVARALRDEIELGVGAGARLPTRVTRGTSVGGG